GIGRESQDGQTRRRSAGAGYARSRLFVTSAGGADARGGGRGLGAIGAGRVGARETTAVVWAENPRPNPRLDNWLKDVEKKLDVPPLKPELRSFVDWVANYTVSSRGMVLRMCLRMGEHLGPERERTGVKLAGAPPQRVTAARG